MMKISLHFTRSLFWKILTFFQMLIIKLNKSHIKAFKLAKFKKVNFIFSESDALTHDYNGLMEASRTEG